MVAHFKAAKSEELLYNIVLLTDERHNYCGFANKNLITKEPSNVKPYYDTKPKGPVVPSKQNGRDGIGQWGWTMCAMVVLQYVPTRSRPCAGGAKYLATLLRHVVTTARPSLGTPQRQPVFI